MSAERAVSFEVLDVEYLNSVASFESEKEAVAALGEIVDALPERAKFLAVVSFDEDGEAITSETADGLLSNA